MQSGFFLGPSVAGLALTWIDVRADIAVTTGAPVRGDPGVLVASSTTQRSGDGLSPSRPARERCSASRRFDPWRSRCSA
jgi:hypothetical protein